MTENEIGTCVIEAATAVHRELGPGLLEAVYEVVLARELTERGLKVVRQAPVPIKAAKLLGLATVDLRKQPIGGGPGYPGRIRERRSAYRSKQRPARA